MHLAFIVLLQLYWLSFSFIGLAIILLIQNQPRFNRFILFLKTTHFIILFLVIMAIGMATLLIYIIPAYLFGLSLTGLKVIYLILLVISAVTLVCNKRELLARLKKSTRQSHITLFVIPAIVVLVMSYLTSLKAGGLIDGDARVFIAMINQWVSTGHLSLSDPYFGWNGVLNLGYSTNLLFGLRALASNLFNASADSIWFYSNAFFMILIWLSFFALSWVFISIKKIKPWAYIILAIVPVLYMKPFFTASLPAAIATVWIVLFVIGIKIYLDSGGSELLVLTSILIATTHTLNSAMTAVFLSLLIIVLAIARSLDRKKALLLIGLGIILMIPVVFAISYPRYVTDSGVTNSLWSIRQIAGQKITAPPSVVPSFIMLLVYGLLLGFFFVHKVVKRKKFLITLYLLILTIIILEFDKFLISLLGYGYIIYINKQRLIRLALMTLVIYFAFLAYNPFIFTIVVKMMPYWAFDRFRQFNVLNYIAPIVGLLFIVQFAFDKMHSKRSVQLTCFIVLPVMIIVLPFLASYETTFPWQSGFSSTLQSKQVATLNTLRKLKDAMQKQVIYSNNPDILTSIPDVMLANFVSLPYEGPSPLANRLLRDRCAQRLHDQLLENDLANAKVDIVLADITYDSTFDRLAESKQYLRIIKQVDNYKVYKVNNVSAISDPSSQVCHFPYRQ